ncbi:hypothetical protein F6J84_04820 [Microbacterium caowuchunii]|uniref:hypothetical protein n=1 Tax=Microbacterium caowuchunii TaxID=2614638 RepID=UPI001249327F|nr:hypothetical protein [Microbacterium caowuchunii]QEV99500.1 hypothetical protein F6J84_04820 [Microbacterium caowuchunii]
MSDEDEDRTRITGRARPLEDESTRLTGRVRDLDDDTRLSARATPVDDETRLSARATPVDDETRLSEHRHPTDATTAGPETDDATRIVTRPLVPPAALPVPADPADPADDATLLVRRPAPAAAGDAEDGGSAPAVAGEDRTELGSRRGGAPVVRRRDRRSVLDEGTALSPRAGRRAEPAVVSTPEALAVPDAGDQGTRRYGIRTVAATAPPATVGAPAQAVTGDGGLAARQERRRALRTRLLLLVGGAVIVMAGALTGLALLLGA